ncbi:hypothetical protein EIP86_004237 [Pleurotus ostreatoroseus]|nr:hypothetical protein EIP86_004237 [Pleurotus ostreatoroseus]
MNVHSGRSITAPPRPYTGIGPLEVLRVALMRGDLDDLRNDLARALRRNDIAPRVLEGLLCGLQGVGIRLDGAREALCVSGGRGTYARVEGSGAVRVADSGVGPKGVVDNGCGSGGTEAGCRGRAAPPSAYAPVNGDEGAPSHSPGPSSTMPAMAERQAETQASAPCVYRCVSGCAAVARASAVYIDPAAGPSTSRISRASFFSFDPDVGPGQYSGPEVALQSDGGRSQHDGYFLPPESSGLMCSTRSGVLGRRLTGIESEKERFSVRASSSSSLNPKMKLRHAISAHDAVAERARSNATSISKGSGKKPTRRKRSGGARWAKAKTSCTQTKDRRYQECAL